MRFRARVRGRRPHLCRATGAARAAAARSRRHRGRGKPRIFAHHRQHGRAVHQRSCQPRRAVHAVLRDCPSEPAELPCAVRRFDHGCQRQFLPACVQDGQPGKPAHARRLHVCDLFGGAAVGGLCRLHAGSLPAQAQSRGQLAGLQRAGVGQSAVYGISGGFFKAADRLRWWCPTSRTTCTTATSPIPSSAATAG